MAQAIRDAIKETAIDRCSNTGLLISRFLRDHDPGSRGNLLQAAVSSSNEAREIYELAFLRWEATVTEGAVRETVEIDGRMVIGLGSESPLETGLTLHHTYGTPLIPGSALKGLAAHYCLTVWGERDAGFRRGGRYFETLFGTTEDSGHIIFYDAWILPTSLSESLVLDVMTVHHSKYYQGETAPTDFDDPNPIQFLSVRGSFAVVLECDVSSEEGKAWVRMALQLLREAMLNWGIGGKTNSGYGRIKGKAAPGRGLGMQVAPGEHQGARQTFPARGHGNSAPMPTRPVSMAVIAPCKAGDNVQAVLLAEKTNKGGWKAKYEWAGRSLSGAIQNWKDVPDNKTPGDRVTLVVASVNNREINFRWPK